MVQDTNQGRSGQLLDESRRNAEIGVGNKGYDESIGSRVHSLNPFLEQFVLEYDGTGEDQQARRGDIGVAKVAAAMIKLTKDTMTESSTLDYTSAMQSMEQDLINNSDPFDIISYEYDIEDSSLNARRLCAAVIKMVKR